MEQTPESLKPERPTAQLNTYIEPSWLERARRVAKKRGLSMSALVRLLLIEAIEKDESPTPSAEDRLKELMALFKDLPRQP